MTGRRGYGRAGLLGLVAMTLVCALPAFTSANAVPATRAGEDSRAVGLNDVKPGECASITLATQVNGSGIISGTSGNDLVLGAEAADTITALLGDDCVLGGGGDDTIDGGLAGQDVCIGGPGTDTFVGCETQIQ